MKIWIILKVTFFSFSLFIYWGSERDRYNVLDHYISLLCTNFKRSCYLLLVTVSKTSFYFFFGWIQNFILLKLLLDYNFKLTGIGLIYLAYYILAVRWLGRVKFWANPNWTFNCNRTRAVQVVFVLSLT